MAGSQNVSRIGAIGNALCPFLMILCHDIPWTTGTWKPVTFNLPEGTVVNPRRPAAVSYNTPFGAGALVLCSVQAALSKMLLSSEKLRSEGHQGYAGTGENGISPIMSGLNKDGTFFVGFTFDHEAAGMGALSDRDGVDSCANKYTPKNQIGNIETYELNYPMLYIFRRELCDGGGPGKFRGGVPIHNCFIPWDTKSINASLLSAGTEPRNSAGLSGGYPPPNVKAGLIKNSDILDKFRRGEFPREVNEIKGEVYFLDCQGRITINEKDVYFSYQCGGGGYGDPIERDPGLVLNDVKGRYVSLEAAKDVYGVVIDPEKFEVDPEKTGEQRNKIIKERLRVGSK